MRAAFSLAGLLIALAIVGLLVKKQLTVARPAPATVVAPGAAGTPALQPDGNYSRAQSQQLQQQVRQSVEAAVQSPRPLPEDAP